MSAQLVFGRDMMFNMKKVIKWKLIKRKQITCDNQHENAKRIEHKYNVGDEYSVSKKESKENTLNIKQSIRHYGCAYKRYGYHYKMCEAPMLIN